MKKTNIIIIIAMIFLALFFVKIGLTKHERGREKKNNDYKKVDAIIVTPSLLSSDITVNGSVEAYDEVELKNEIAGRVVAINLPEGKIVRKGTMLIKLYDDDLKATLKKLQAQLEIEKEIYNRQSKLLKVNGISQNDFDQTALQVRTLGADIEEEKALICKTEIRAPFDGTIGLRNISIGAVISASTSLATIRTNQKLKLDFYVPEKYSSVVSVGMKLNFNVYDEAQLYQAKVMATEHGIDNATGNLKVRALITSASKDLIPGAFADVNLKLGENPKALMIPTQAIIPEEENKTVIIVREGKAHFVNVKTGIRKSAKIEVTDGLTPGDTVIVNGILFLKEGSKLFYSSVSR